MAKPSLISITPRFVTLTFAVTILVLAFIITNPTKTQALNGSQFNPGYIIDDSVFYNPNTMSPQQIQMFLDSKMPECDTDGSEIYSGSTTRAQYGTSNGSPPPYTCLKDFRMNTETVAPESGLCGGYAGAGNESAATIIFKVAQSCGINSQVLLVLLQKEQSLITDEWPWPMQYTKATGYNCPDSDLPDSEDANHNNCVDWSEGFSRQVYYAALRFKSYRANANNFNYRAGRNNVIYWQTNLGNFINTSGNANDPSRNGQSGCGYSNVYIQNQATAALYIYTPYQPNQAALGALYGTGDACSAYGNRNFWRLFSDWFGVPNYTPPSCDSKLSGVSCVWRLSNPVNQTEFLTTNNNERDSVVRNNKYSYDNIAFYAFTTSRPGTVPVYRIKMSDRHFYTTSQSEVSSLTANSQNTLEGIAFYVYPTDGTSNSTYQVYRLNGTSGHLFVASVSERDRLIARGNTYEGVAFNTPSAFATAPTPSASRQNVYRINSSQSHLYTVNLHERDNLLRGNWKYEGILLQAPITQTGSPVYRMHNGSKHLLTSSATEKNQLLLTGWKYEGVAWHTDAQIPRTYRFFVNGGHFYTSALSEALVITNRGAKYEGIAFGNSPSSTLPVYRLYDGKYHLLTSNINEVINIANSPWRYEGVAWQASSSGSPVYRLKGPYHFFTKSEQEKSVLMQAGWQYEGVAWNTDGAAPTIYRMKGLYHFFTGNSAEKNALVGGGWQYEGVAW